MNETIGTDITVANKYEDMINDYLKEEEYDTDLFFKTVEQLPYTMKIKKELDKVVVNLAGIIVRKMRTKSKFTDKELKIMGENYNQFLDIYYTNDIGMYGLVIMYEVGKYKLFITSEVIIITNGERNNNLNDIKEYLSEEVYNKLSKEFIESISKTPQFEGIVLMHSEDLGRVYLKEGLFLTELFSLFNDINEIRDYEKEDNRGIISEIIKRETAVINNEPGNRQNESNAISEQIRNAVNEDRDSGRLFSDNELEEMLGIVYDNDTEKQ